MFAWFYTAARYKLYVAVVLSTLRTLYAGHAMPAEAPEAADAIAAAVLAAPRELPPELQGVRLAVTMAAYARFESDVQKHPCARRRDPDCADGGRAGGYWQLHQPAGFSEDARVQAYAWVELVRQSVRLCGNPTAALAMTLSGHCHRGLRQTATRLLAVEHALNAWNASQAETPTPFFTAALPPPAGRRRADGASDPQSSFRPTGPPAFF